MCKWAWESFMGCDFFWGFILQNEMDFFIFFYFTWRQKSQRMTRGNAEFIHKVQQRSQMGNLWSNFTAQTHADIHVRSSSRALVMTKMNHHEEWCSSVHISHRERSNQMKRFNIFRNLWRFFLLKKSKIFPTKAKLSGQFRSNLNHPTAPQLWR